MKLTELINTPVHDAAKLFPMMDREEKEGGKGRPGPLYQLADDIKANGCHTPVVLFAGTILDGRNRIAAAELAGLDELPTTEYTGTDPLMYVLSLNLHRRHLTAKQLVELGARIAGPIAERAAANVGGRGNLASEEAQIRTSEAVSEALGGAVSRATLERGWAVMERSPELWAQVGKSESVTGAYNKIVVPPTKTAESSAEKVLDSLETVYLRFVDCLDDLRNTKPNAEQWRVAELRVKSLAENIASGVKG